MSVFALVALLKKHILPRAVANPQAAEFDSLQSAGEFLKGWQKFEAEYNQIPEAQRDAEAALEKARSEYAAAVEQINEQRRKLNDIRAKKDRAEQFVLRHSPESDEEKTLRARVQQLQIDLGQLRGRHNIHATHMDPPEKIQVFAELQLVNDDIRCAELAIDRQQSGATPGHSNAERRLPGLLRERDSLAGKVERYRTQYERWQEIDALKQQIQNLYDRRMSLRKQREGEAIATAIKAAK